jgi:toxin ParE1/3/4
MKVLRQPQYWDSLQAIEDSLAYDNPSAAVDLWLHSDDQVSKPSDPNFPRRRGRVPGALELVAHPNFVVILEQTLDTVMAIEVLHVATKHP